MRILIVGGTRFVGHAIATAALAAGHEVALLHRHATSEFPDIEHLLADRDVDLSVLARGDWDATIDVCAYRPRQVTMLHNALGARAGHYLLVSTISVYAPLSLSGADESATVLPEPEPGDLSADGNSYGALKVGCEQVARRRWGKSAVTVVRPTYIFGPRDMSGRFTWWIERASRGGRMILPGPNDAPMQHIDVRDLAAWAVQLVADRTAGSFTAARRATSFERFLTETIRALDAPAELVPIDAELLLRHGVAGAELPLWTEGIRDPRFALAVQRAEATGLAHRPFAETVRDTWEWARANPDLADTGLGISPEREKVILDAASMT